MAVTRSTAAERPRTGRARKTGWRRDELIGLAAATLILAFGLFQVYRAKSADLAAIDHGLTSKQLLDLNALTAREELLPALSSIPDQHAREEAGRRGWRFESIPGDLRLFEKLVAGDWDEREFLVVPPGRQVVADYGGGLISIKGVE